MSMENHLVLLGRPVTDRVTGFAGVVTGIHFDLFGCIQAVVKPPAKDSKTADGEWFDVKRLKIVGDAVMDAPAFNLPVGDENGPDDKPPMRRSPL